MKPMFVILLYIVIHIQITLPHLKYRLCLFIIPIFLSHGMGRSVDKDLRRPDHSFLWTRGRTLLGAYRLPDQGMVLDCNRSSGSICAGFYFILVWILSIIRIRAEVSWLFLDFIYLPKKHFTKLKILFSKSFVYLMKI